MIRNQYTSPTSPHYLPPNESPSSDCGVIAPEEIFNVPWTCTRKKGHDGDHAAHADMGRVSKDDPVTMVARWGAE